MTKDKNKKTQFHTRGGEEFMDHEVREGREVSGGYLTNYYRERT